jgi:hypothetical protein
MIKALLKRYKYPPDQEVAAIELVIQQTEMISEEWSRQDLGDCLPISFANSVHLPADAEGVEPTSCQP